MYVLSADLSSVRHSVSLAAGEQVLEHRWWIAKEASRQAFFLEIEAMMGRRSIAPSLVSLFVVGLGPGNYSGMRTSLAAAEAFMLPGRGRVFGISSAAVSAYEVALNNPGANRIAVAGDARRGRAWLAVFKRDSRSGVLPERDIRLCSVGDLRAAAAGCLLVSADSGSLVACTANTCSSGADAITTSFPDAAMLTELCRLRMANGIQTEPLSPNYAHPPVHALPR